MRRRDASVPLGDGRALDAGLPPLSMMFKDVFAEMPERLRKKRDDVLGGEA